MKMKIEDLYLELGRAMTEKVTVGQASQAKQVILQDQVQTLNRELQSERDRVRNQQERIQQHVDELQEAIRLASEGIDPCLAKLTAKEALEERRKYEKGNFDQVNAAYYGNIAANAAAAGGVGIGYGGSTLNTTFIPYYSTCPVTVTSNPVTSNTVYLPTK